MIIILHTTFSNHSNSHPFNFHSFNCFFTLTLLSAIYTQSISFSLSDSTNCNPNNRQYLYCILLISYVSRFASFNHTQIHTLTQTIATSTMDNRFTVHIHSSKLANNSIGLRIVQQNSSSK